LRENSVLGWGAAPRRRKQNGCKMRAGFIALSLSAALLAGCGGTKIKQTFDLSSAAAGAGAEVKAPRSAAQIMVNNPGALRDLDSQNIVIRGGDGSIAYLQGAQWTDHLTNMVQARLIQALEDSQRFGGVGSPRDGMNATYQLITGLRAFGVDIDAEGKFANVEISAKIMDSRTGQIRRTHIFSAKYRVNGSSNGDYAVALDSAFATVLQEIVRWTAQSL